MMHFSQFHTILILTVSYRIYDFYCSQEEAFVVSDFISIASRW